MISIIPLIGGNTDDTKYVIRKNQTPQQITEFIQANIDNTGKKLFTTLVDMDSGMFGSESTSANDWSLITSETSQSKQFARFAVCAGVSDGVVAMLTYPDEISDYDLYKDKGRMYGFAQRSLYAASDTLSRGYITLISGHPDRLFAQADYNAITLVVYDFRPDAE